MKKLVASLTSAWCTAVRSKNRAALNATRERIGRRSGRRAPVVIAAVGAVIFGGGAAVLAATSTVSVTAADPQCAIDGASASACPANYTVQPGHSLTISARASTATDSAGGAGAAFVQGSEYAGSATSLSKAFSADVHAGDLLVAMVRATGTPSVSDNVDGNWTEAAVASDGVNSLWYRANATGGATTVTVDGSSSGSMRLVAAEYSGIASSPYDTSTCSTGTGQTATVAATGAAAGELSFTGLGAYPSGITATADPQGALRNQFSGSSGTSADEDTLSTTQQTVTPSLTLSSAPNGGWAVCTALFKPAADTTTASGSTTTSGTTSTPGVGSPYDSKVLGDGPAAYWAMNATGTETDLTANGNTGTYKGSQPPLTTMPNGDQAADFNPNGASGEYLTVPSSATFSIPTTGDLTWEAWIRPDVLQLPHLDSTSEYVDFLGKCQNYNPTCEWEGRMYATTNSENRPNRISAYAFNPSAGLGSAGDWQPNSNMLRAGQWLYVVGEYTTLSSPTDCGSDNIVAYPGSLNIWVNGVEWNQPDHADTGCMAQHDVAPTANGSPLDIGTMALDSWFSGAIGKVAIYDKLLSQAQINAHYAAMTGAQPSGSCASICTIPVPTP